MSKKKMLGSQVKQFLSGVTAHGTEHLLELESDLVQTAILLAEAIEKLGASFLALHTGILHQQEEIDLLIGSGVMPESSLQRLQEIKSEIALHVNSAVTSLQFQDMTNQLISRTVQRSAGLRDAINSLGQFSEGIPHDSGMDEIVLHLTEISNSLHAQSLELKNLLRKAVDQQHLNSGDIELF